MSLKFLKPVTPSMRGAVLLERSSLWKGKPYKSLVSGKKLGDGRNNFGRITAWKKGGGHKVKYRTIDFCRRKSGLADVLRIEYDPCRTAFIALIRYANGEHSYILAPQKLAEGDKVSSGLGSEIAPGNAMPLKQMPVGTMVHNIELKVGKGGQIARAAGCYAQIVGRDEEYILLRLRSGETRKVHGLCYATIGVLSNPDNQNISFGKAGRRRWLGIRPTVRGVAMNPVDHPHGGGEGKTSGGRHPVTPWGKSTKGKKTRSNPRTDRWILTSRHSKKK